MSLELLAIVLTGVVSFLDVVVNIFGLCMSGHCQSSCCGVNMTHDESSQHGSCRRSDE